MPPVVKPSSAQSAKTDDTELLSNVGDEGDQAAAV